MRVINIDWLQLNCRHKSFYDYECQKPFTIKPTDIHTRQFKTIDELYYEDELIATIAREPVGDIIDPLTILIKFNNNVLYRHNLHDYIIDVLNSIQLKIHNLTRLDIAMDFQKMNEGMTVYKLIDGFMAGKYLKIGKGKGTLIFNHNYAIEKEYLKFGSNTSNICYYLYNKSKELYEVKNKPWIQDNWLANGFDQDATTWRLEFSLKNGNSELIEYSTSEVSIVKSMKFLERDVFEKIFYTLLKKYFTFFINDFQMKKTRMKKIKLFSNVNSDCNIKFVVGKKESGRSDKIFINKLNSLNDELRKFKKDQELESQKILLNHFINSRNLHRYAKRKGIEL